MDTVRGLFVIVLLVTLAGCTSGPSSGDNAGAPYEDIGDNGYTRSYDVNANLTPPITTFTVMDHVSQMFRPPTNGTAPSAYTYAWTNSNTCGRFTPNGATATWYHGDDTDCSHATPVHAGTISVLIGGLSDTDSSTGYMACEYTQGSASGVGSACFVSSIAPANATPARRTSVPIPSGGAPLVVGGGLLAALAATRRRARE